MSTRCDAVVVGSGPNGLAAAITLARAGLKVLVREAAPVPGGALRTEERTLPGFRHDIGSTVQALAQVSPFFKTVPLEKLGVRFDYPAAAFGQTLPNGGAVLLEGSVEETARQLGADAASYRKLFGPIVRDWEMLIPALLGPPATVPRHPLALALFGRKAICSAHRLQKRWFRQEAARALFAGAAAHAILPFDRPASSAFGLVLMASAHARGWPVARGGSQTLAEAMVAHLRALGGEVVCNAPVETLEEFEAVPAVLCDLTPRQLLAVAGSRLPGRYANRLRRFRYGPGVFKIDWALSGPVPWKNRELLKAGTVHVGAGWDEIAASEAATWGEGPPTGRPFLILVQASLFDPTRAPEGKQTLWGYAHVPHGATGDFTPLIEEQIERYAPGFRDTVLARSILRPADLERFDTNLIGGDITGGAQTLDQTFTRPVAKLDPYATPVKGLYLCSASTPPGGGVHGMCGYNAARSALKKVFGITRLAEREA